MPSAIIGHLANEFDISVSTPLEVWNEFRFLVESHSPSSAEFMGRWETSWRQARKKAGLAT